MELSLEARGDYHIEVNIFDPVFYFLDKEGEDAPSAMYGQKVSSFHEVFNDFQARARLRPTVLRSAAYAVSNHIEEADWSNMSHCFLIRDPRYTLPSHRKFVRDITPKEAGYTSQLKLYLFLKEKLGLSPFVIDTTELLTNPREILSTWCQAIDIPFLPESLNWPPGFRERWGMWKRWKKDAAKSTGFALPQEDPQIALAGENDPLFAQSQECYKNLYQHRLTY